MGARFAQEWPAHAGDGQVRILTPPEQTHRPPEERAVSREMGQGCDRRCDFAPYPDSVWALMPGNPQILPSWVSLRRQLWAGLASQAISNTLPP